MDNSVGAMAPSREPSALGYCGNLNMLCCMFCFVAAILFCGGCGHHGGQVPINGEVTFDGKPVEEGSISFEPIDGNGAATGGKIIHGKYELTGQAAPLSGKKIVRISGGRKTGRKIPAGQPAPAGTMIDEVVRYIPDTYGPQSTLTCEIVASGPDKFDFNLKR